MFPATLTTSSTEPRSSKHCPSQETCIQSKTSVLSSVLETRSQHIGQRTQTQWSNSGLSPQELGICLPHSVQQRRSSVAAGSDSLIVVAPASEPPLGGEGGCCGEGGGCTTGGGAIAAAAPGGGEDSGISFCSDGLRLLSPPAWRPLLPWSLAA